MEVVIAVWIWWSKKLQEAGEKQEHVLVVQSVEVEALELSKHLMCSSVIAVADGVVVPRVVHVVAADSCWWVQPAVISHVAVLEIGTKFD